MTLRVDQQGCGWSLLELQQHGSNDDQPTIAGSAQDLLPHSLR
jgi:hypothetical protein